MKASRNLIQSLLLGVVMLPVLVQAQFVFVTNNGAITITGYKGSGGAVVILDTTNGWPVTSIGQGAFAFSGSLTSVTIPDSVTSLGIFAFYACSNLTAAIISTNITSIGVSSFDSCSSLTNVTIPGGVTNIGSSAFQNCAGITSVAIPAGVASIGQYAFDSCGSLLTIAVDPQNANYSSSDGILFNGDQTTLIQYPGGKAGNYTIPNSVTSIGNFAFDSCTSLTSIAISSSIGDWAFSGCSGLNKVAIANGIINIGCYAFEFCSSLTTVTIPDSITTIGKHTFDDCTSLTDVTIDLILIPSSIASGSFSGCSSLTSIYLAGVSPSFFWNPTNQIATPTAYYLPGANPSSISNLPTALWLPQVQGKNASFGIQTNQFGFNINWASFLTVVVEACTNLANPLWTPVGTNTLASGSIYFSDPQWTNYPGRFYRVHGLNVFGQ